MFNNNTERVKFILETILRGIEATDDKLPPADYGYDKDGHHRAQQKLTELRVDADALRTALELAQLPYSSATALLRIGAALGEGTLADVQAFLGGQPTAVEMRRFAESFQETLEQRYNKALSDRNRVKNEIRSHEKDMRDYNGFNSDYGYTRRKLLTRFGRFIDGLLINDEWAGKALQYLRRKLCFDRKDYGPTFKRRQDGQWMLTYGLLDETIVNIWETDIGHIEGTLRAMTRPPLAPPFNSADQIVEASRQRGQRYFEKLTEGPHYEPLNRVYGNEAAGFASRYEHEDGWTFELVRLAPDGQVEHLFYRNAVGERHTGAHRRVTESMKKCAEAFEAPDKTLVRFWTRFDGSVYGYQLMRPGTYDAVVYAWEATITEPQNELLEKYAASRNVFSALVGHTVAIPNDELTDAGFLEKYPRLIWTKRDLPEGIELPPYSASVTQWPGNGDWIYYLQERQDGSLFIEGVSSGWYRDIHCYIEVTAEQVGLE